MSNQDTGWTPEHERAAMDALAVAKDEWRSAFPDFSIGEALKTHPNAIRPEVFHEIANDEMQRIYDCSLTIGEDLEIPFDHENKEDLSLYREAMWLTQRNLILMEKYLKDQIAKGAEPERIREDLISLDRYLNDWLRSECLEPEDAEEELGDYFAKHLIKQEPLPSFTHEFGALGRFYSWLEQELTVQNHLNYNEVPTPRMCELLLINLRRNIPFLTRMYEIATDPANDRPEPKSLKSKKKRSGRVSGKPKLDREAEESVSEKRLKNWRVDQVARNRSILAQFRRALPDRFDWDPEDVSFAVEIAEMFLIDTLPMALLPAEQCSYYLTTFLRQTCDTLGDSGDPDLLERFGYCYAGMTLMLEDMGLIQKENSLGSSDPYYPHVPDPEELEEGYAPENPDIAWGADQEPDVYEEHLNWLKWNIERNSLFAAVFQDELIASGMDLERIDDHVYFVSKLMAEALRYIGSPMEALPEGLDELLAQGIGTADFLTDPISLRRAVGSLRRFYRIMIKRGFLPEEEGEALLSYLKKNTRFWLERLRLKQEGPVSRDAMDSIWL